ncbi:MAG: helix-turn-helix transcriptional regulator [Candidatus Latescibacterota bacterium]|nr:helix-turn-helix transcriptional regulator [Candidatus Latescibacterota bacterium]
MKEQTFGSLIALRRKELNLSQRALAQKITTESKPGGVWSTYIGQVEKGDRVPSSEVCQALAEILQLNPLLLLALVYKFKASTSAEFELAEILIAAVSSKAESAESDTFEFLVDRFNGRSEHGEDSTVSEEFFSIISELSRENIKLLTNIARALHEKQQLQE